MDVDEIEENATDGISWNEFSEERTFETTFQTAFSRRIDTKFDANKANVQSPNKKARLTTSKVNATTNNLICQLRLEFYHESTRLLNETIADVQQKIDAKLMKELSEWLDETIAALQELEESTVVMSHRSIAIIVDHGDCSSSERSARFEQLQSKCSSVTTLSPHSCSTAAAGMKLFATNIGMLSHGKGGASKRTLLTLSTIREFIDKQRLSMEKANRKHSHLHVPLVFIENADAFPANVLEDVLLMFSQIRVPVIISTSSDIKLIAELSILRSARVFHSLPTRDHVNDLLHRLLVDSPALWCVRFDYNFLSWLLNDYTMEHASISTLTYTLRVSLWLHCVFNSTPASALFAKRALKCIDNGQISVQTIRELLEHDKSVDRERIDNMTEETDGHDLVTDILGDLETAHNVRMIWLNALWRLIRSGAEQVRVTGTYCNTVVHLYMNSLHPNAFPTDLNSNLCRYICKAIMSIAKSELERALLAFRECITQEGTEHDLRHSVANKLTTFIERVQRVDQDQEEADKKQIKKQIDDEVTARMTAAKPRTPMNRVTIAQVQSKLRKSISIANDSVFVKLQKELCNWLLAQTQRLCVEHLPLYECICVKYSQQLRDMIRPEMLINADNALNVPRQHSLQLIGRTRETKEDDNDDCEPDLVRLLRFIRNLVDGRGKIELTKLFKYFTNMQNEKGDEPALLAAFFTSLAELELIGCIKTPPGQNFPSAVQRLYHPWLPTTIDTEFY